MGPCPFKLRAQVSYCRVGERLIFLDLARDRYACLAEDGERSFRRLASGAAPRGGDERVLDRLVDDRLLERSTMAGGPPAECARPPAPVRSLVETNCRPSLSCFAHACLRLGLTLAAFRLRPLRRYLARLAARKARLGDPPERPEPAVAEIAAAFRQTQFLFAPLDRCLPHSLAIAHALIDAGFRPDLVIGVKLRPFAAHCLEHAPAPLTASDLDMRTGHPAEAGEPFLKRGSQASALRFSAMRDCSNSKITASPMVHFGPLRPIGEAR
jgi:hypothetical protein